MASFIKRKFLIPLMFLFAFSLPCFAYQKVELDLGSATPWPSYTFFANHRLAYQQDNYYLIQREIGSLIYNSNDSWQLALAYDTKTKWNGFDFYPGLALSRSIPTPSIALSPMVYISKPALFNFFGDWDLQADAYAFSDGASGWFALNNKVKLWGYDFRWSPLGGFINMKYQNFSFSYCLNFSAGMTILG
ncbi:MAG: hypothetical protein NT099_04140 [Candidatus Saganbacteria bacterium]|nr:hypothetical protein [Candidatus Saganbacteria bacterium]